MAIVLARPGTPSTRMWPLASRATSSRSRRWSWPTMTRLTSYSTRSTGRMRSRSMGPVSMASSVRRWAWSVGRQRAVATGSVDGHGEADAREGLGVGGVEQRDDDADDPTAPVEERATGVARVDRGVELEQPRHGDVTVGQPERALAPRDDARRQRAEQPVGAADRVGLAAHRQPRVAEHRRLDTLGELVGLEDRDVLLGLLLDHDTLGGRAVRERERDGVRALDHVERRRGSCPSVDTSTPLPSSSPLSLGSAGVSLWVSMSTSEGAMAPNASAEKGGPGICDASAASTRWSMSAVLRGTSRGVSAPYSASATSTARTPEAKGARRPSSTRIRRRAGARAGGSSKRAGWLGPRARPIGQSSQALELRGAITPMQHGPSPSRAATSRDSLGLVDESGVRNAGWHHRGVTDDDEAVIPSARLDRSAAARDHLANERTLLAWQRTALALLGLGFLVDRFAFEGRGGTVAGSILGLALIAIGALASVAGTVRFLRTERDIEQATYRPAHLAHLLLTGRHGRGRSAARRAPRGRAGPLGAGPESQPGRSSRVSAARPTGPRMLRTCPDRPAPSSTRASIRPRSASGSSGTPRMPPWTTGTPRPRPGRAASSS